ncbi:hypothetical protein [Metapseudomonas resinovorans]|uniref:hypothetical protein n=1 Tax=Metapseudomonas resinovorans TaxID=53412 RepID=UPI00041F3779|nr:hypothetical protein [Pseudomonas resinovorans]
MTPEQFAYWLQGFAELNPQAPTAEQWRAIRDHLNLVFKKETPVRIGPTPRIPFMPVVDDRTSPRFPNLPDFTRGPLITC